MISGYSIPISGMVLLATEILFNSPARVGFMCGMLTIMAHLDWGPPSPTLTLICSGREISGLTCPALSSASALTVLVMSSAGCANLLL